MEIIIPIISVALFLGFLANRLNKKDNSEEKLKSMMVFKSQKGSKNIASANLVLLGAICEILSVHDVLFRRYRY